MLKLPRAVIKFTTFECMKKTLQGLLILLLIVTSGCSTTTKLTGTWKPEESKPVTLNKIAVIGIAKKPEIRKIAEDAIERKLIENQVNAIAALEFLPPGASKENISLEIVRGFLNSYSFDGVITISLLSINDDRRYVPGGYIYAPISVVPFYDYYGQMSNYLYSPAYYTGTVSMFLETNLYSYPDGTLLWSAQTESVDLYDKERVASSLAEVLVEALINDNVIITRTEH